MTAAGSGRGDAADTGSRERRADAARPASPLRWTPWAQRARRTRRPGSDAPYVAALCLLTVATGMLDAVSFLALDQVFVGNMTGNVLFIGYAAVGAGSVPLLNNAVALGGFFAGATVAGAIVRGRRGRPRLSRAHLAVLTANALAVTAIAVAWLALWRPAGGWLLALTAVLAASMGAQAVAVRGAKIPDITTVVITSTLVNFAMDSPLAGGRGQHWAPRLGAVLAMAAGGALGALLATSWTGAGALLAAGLVMAIAALVLTSASRAEQAQNS